MAESLSLFDREMANIRGWQRWAAELFAADANDMFAAEMCRDYSLKGVDTAALRLNATEKIPWMELCVVACCRLGDRHGLSPVLLCFIFGEPSFGNPDHFVSILTKWSNQTER